MPVGAFVPSRIHLDYPEWQAPTGSDSGKVWAWNGSGYAPVTLAFDPSGTAAAAVAAHVVAENPHTQYLLASGVSAYGATLIDDADAAAARGTLGLGAAAVLNVGTSANNVVQLTAAAKLPAVDGSLLTGITATASPGGSTTQVQYNSGGSFAGDAGMTYDVANDRLTVTGGFVAPSIRPASDSTTAFQVKTAGGTAVWTVDTTNRKVAIDGSGAGNITLLTVNGYGSSSTGLLLKSGLEFPTSTKAIDVQVATGTSIFSVDARYGTIYTADKFGIGIAPVTPLHLYMGTGNEMLRLEGPYTANYIYLKNLDANWSIGRDRNTANGFHIAESSTLMTSTRLSILTGGIVGINNISPTAYLDLPASTTARASLRIRAGTAPTSPAPNVGDVYQDGTHVYMYLAGAWKQLDN